MIKLNKQNRTLIIRALVAILLLVTFVYVMLPIVNIPTIKNAFENAGAVGYFAIILSAGLSQVFVPWFGGPLFMFSLSLYGYKITAILFYIAGSVSCIICFCLARKYGRPIIKKLSGQWVLDKIDSLSINTEFKGYVIARIFGFTIFDIISYAAGLTKIPFKPFYIVSLVVPAIQYTLLTYLFQFIDFTTAKGMFTYLAIMGLIFLVFTAVITFKKKYINTKEGII